MASYASEVKKELTQLEVHPEHARAELAALLRMNGTLSINQHHFILNVQTENPAIARRIYTLLRRFYYVEAELLVRRKMKLKKNNQYIVRLRQDATRVLEDLGILLPGRFAISTAVPDWIKDDRQRARSYLRGAFLAGGSVNNPETSRYHLEIYSLYEDHNDDLLALFNQVFELKAHTSERRSGYIVYLKEAERISEFLQVVGATHAMLKFEDILIVRDMRNSVNRLVNCETANLNKTINAAAKQLASIQLLKQAGHLESLPDKLKEVALLRLAYPEASLGELAQHLSGARISKSGINHRLRKLVELAEKL